MSGWLDVIDGGIGNSIQDAGRFGYRHMGIATSGFLDPIFAACANALAGSGDGAACIEIRVIGPMLKVRQGPVRIALTGNISATLQRHGGSNQTLEAWHSATLETGDILKCSAVSSGTAYLAVSGGIDLVPQLGSRSTYLRAGIGGLDGRLLVSGDALPCQKLARNEYREYRAEPWQHSDGPLRVIAGPQSGHFTVDAQRAFETQPWTVTTELDRMGMRLAGTSLTHSSPAHADIVSDAVTPGTLQVPGNGQPIILLADCQTVGGYPKIATIISADLPRLGQTKPGDQLRFTAVDLAQACQIRATEDARRAQWKRGITTYLPAGYLDETALYTSNLISGAVRADPPLRD